MSIYDLRNLLLLKETLEEELNRLDYGSIEIRKINNKEYIYVHYRDNNKCISRYIDEYSIELFNEITNNNLIAKKIKKEIKDINNKIKDIDYLKDDLSKKVKINIDFIKKNLVDTIYNQSILEGISTTELETENIIEGGIVNGISSNDVMKIKNLKKAWDFLLEKTTILSNTDYSLLSYINKLVIDGFYYNTGLIRTTPVKIGGTTWIPEFPIEYKIKEDINKIINSKISNIDKAIELLLYIMKKQVFIDGNKRTAVIFANHFLIKKGLGLIVIPAELTEKFKKMLIDYYEGKDNKKIKEFLKDMCYINIY